VDVPVSNPIAVGRNEFHCRSRGCFSLKFKGNQLNTTTTRMELTAVLEAVTSLKKPVTLSVFTANANVVGWLNKRFKRKDPHVEALCMSIEKAVLARGVKLA
jgi:ribonuclease HI